MGTLDILFGGGGGCGDRVLCFGVLLIAVLVLAVCSIYFFLVVLHIGHVLFLVLHAVVGGV